MWTNPLGLPVGIAIWLVTLAVAVGLLVLSIRWSRSLGTRAYQAEYRLCPACTKPFESDEPTHTCAKCHLKFNTLSARDKWRRVVVEAAPDLFGPTPRQARRMLSDPKLLVPAICMFLLWPASQVISKYVSSVPKIINTPTPITTNSGKQIILQMPTSVPPSTTELTIARINTYLPLFGTGGVGAFALYAGVRFSRASKAAKAHNYLVCSQCLYPLDTCPDDGNCPECGTEYESHNLRSKWFRVIAQKDPYEAYKTGEIDEFMPL